MIDNDDSLRRKDGSKGSRALLILPILLREIFGLYVDNMPKCSVNQGLICVFIVKGPGPCKCPPVDHTSTGEADLGESGFSEMIIRYVAPVSLDSLAQNDRIDKGMSCRYGSCYCLTCNELVQPPVP